MTEVEKRQKITAAYMAILDVLAETDKDIAAHTYLEDVKATLILWINGKEV